MYPSQTPSMIRITLFFSVKLMGLAIRQGRSGMVRIEVEKM